MDLDKALDFVKELPDETTPATKDLLKQIVKATWECSYPVGKTEIFYDTADHSKYLGFTWERTAQGYAVVGYKSGDSDFGTIGKTLGEKTHTMTLKELVKHKHTSLLKSQNVYAVQEPGGWATTYETSHPDVDTTEVGEGSPFNIIQPSQVFAIWKRIK